MEMLHRHYLGKCWIRENVYGPLNVVPACNKHPIVNYMIKYYLIDNRTIVPNPYVAFSDLSFLQSENNCCFAYILMLQ